MLFVVARVVLSIHLKSTTCKITILLFLLNGQMVRFKLLLKNGLNYSTFRFWQLELFKLSRNSASKSLNYSIFVLPTTAGEIVQPEIEL
jgi:hypothetical protein